MSSWQLKFDSYNKSAKGGSFSKPGTAWQYPPDLRLEPVHIDLNLTVDVEAQVAEGTVTLSIQANDTGAATLTLDAIDFQNLSVVDTSGKALTHSYDGTKLRVTWADAFTKGEDRKLAVSYRVEQPITGMMFSKPSERYPDHTWWAATDHETERARYWLPCIDLPAVRQTLEFHLKTQSQFTVLANGEHVKDEDHGNGWKTSHWSCKQRCPSYLLCFAIGDFVEYDDGEFRGKPLKYYTCKDFQPEDLKRAFGKTGKMLEWMTNKLDMDLPWPKYYQFALPNIGGAMENISLVSWDDFAPQDETMAHEFWWLVDQINLHEMAHTWFGDHIVCRDYAHAWLKESWAVYMESLYLEDTYGVDEKDYDFYRNAQAYLTEADSRYARPIVTREFESSWEMYDRHLYPGGACRLHTLRSEVGDDVFFAATRDYLKRYAGKTVETEDFRKVMEEHCGRSLVQFFDQWIYRAGYPNIKVSFSYDNEKKLGTFEVEQTQVKVDDKDPSKSIKPFVIDTNIGWVVEGEMHTKPVRIESAKHAFTVPMAKEPEQVRFDPLCRALHKLEFNPGDAKLRAQVSGAKDVIGRILAAHELAKTGKAQNLKAVRDAWKQEKFWGVKQQFFEALGSSKSEVALECLLEMVGEEKDALVLETAFNQLGTFRDSRVQELCKSRIAGGLPYRAHNAALSAIGSQRDQADFDFLMKATEDKRFNGIIEGGAYRALAETRSPAAFEILLKASRQAATGHRARKSASSSLGKLATYLPKEKQVVAREALEDIVREPLHFNAVMHPMQGLAALKDPAGAAALEDLRTRQPLQWALAVDKAIKACRGGGDSAVKAVTDQLEKLEDKNRKLEDRLRKLEEKLDAK